LPANTALPAVYALVVDAKNDQAVAFYKQYGFRMIVDRPRTPFIPMATAQRSFSEERFVETFKFVE